MVMPIQKEVGYMGYKHDTHLHSQHLNSQNNWCLTVIWTGTSGQVDEGKRMGWTRWRCCCARHSFLQGKHQSFCIFLYHTNLPNVFEMRKLKTKDETRHANWQFHVLSQIISKLDSPFNSLVNQQQLHHLIVAFSLELLLQNLLFV